MTGPLESLSLQLLARQCAKHVPLTLDWKGGHRDGGLTTEQLRGVRNPSRHTVQRGARSERVRPTGCFREAVNQQNPLKPGVRELPIPRTARPASPPWRGKPNRWPKPRQRGSSPTRKWVRQSQDLWSADARLTGERQGLRGNPRLAAGKACKARRPESTRGRVGSYSGQGAAVELGNPPAFPPPRGSDGRSDRRARAAGTEPA